MSQSSIFIACDHAGYLLKEKIISTLSLGFEDLGTHSEDSVDYPDFAHRLCLRMIAVMVDPAATPQGILICGSGQGVAMTANKYPEIRAALCWNEESARLARKHNNANVLCLSSKLVDESLNLKIIKAFLETPFEGGRHQLRVGKMSIA